MLSHFYIQGADITENSIANVVWHHKGDYSAIVRIGSGEFIIPPSCSFLLSDITFLELASKGISS